MNFFFSFGFISLLLYNLAWVITWNLGMAGSMVGSASGMPNTTINLPVDGPGWVELLLKELTSASDMNDAKTRVSKILELFEKFVAAHASHEPLESLCKVPYF